MPVAEIAPLSSSDAFNLVTPTKASHDPLLFNSRGKVYDGWETRRRRDPKRDGDTHGLADWAIIRLATPAIVRGVNIDTSFFKGNFPTHASVEGTTLLDHPTLLELLVVPLVLVLVNLNEWHIHRNILHARTWPLEILFWRHTPEHHVIFVRDVLSRYQPDALRYFLCAAAPEVITRFSIGTLEKMNPTVDRSLPSWPLVV